VRMCPESAATSQLFFGIQPMERDTTQIRVVESIRVPIVAPWKSL